MPSWGAHGDTKCSRMPKGKMSAPHFGNTPFRSTTGAIQVSVPPSGRALRVSTRARPRSSSLGHTFAVALHEAACTLEVTMHDARTPRVG
eukprot:9532817-Lingulodinium_polyedra.AAC.1